MSYFCDFNRQEFGMSQEMFFKHHRRGFTLIELLIVIAIILILIAIALPNFLEAQTRAKVTKAKAEIRSISLAMEQYFLDWKIYPCETESDIYSPRWGRTSKGHIWLTSPIKYLSKIPEDPFYMGHPDTVGPGASSVLTYETGGIEPNPSKHPMGRKCISCMLTWAMWSKGPSHEDTGQVVSGDDAHRGNGGRDNRNYSPTNGTNSRGALLTWGGDPVWIGFPMSNADPSKLGAVPPDPVWVDGQMYVRRLPPKM